MCVFCIACLHVCLPAWLSRPCDSALTSHPLSKRTMTIGLAGSLPDEAQTERQKQSGVDGCEWVARTCLREGAGTGPTARSRVVDPRFSSCAVRYYWSRQEGKSRATGRFSVAWQWGAAVASSVAHVVL